MSRKITYAGARNKGKSFERHVAKKLCGIGLNAKRVPMSGALSWMKGDVREFDVTNPHVHECKNCQTLELPSWWRQTVSQAKDDEVPVLHFTSNYRESFTMLPANDFDDMVEAYEIARTELVMSATDFPQRKNFWRFTASKNMSHHVLLYSVDEMDLVIVSFDFYLMLREQSVGVASFPNVSPQYAVA